MNFSLGAYTISREPVKWFLLGIPHVNNTKPIPRWEQIGAKEYVHRLAEKRNSTLDMLLQKHPDTTHVLCCDEYYVHNVKEMRKLIDDYLKGTGDFILGGGVWGIWRYRISDFFHCKLQWADKWSVKLPCYHYFADQYLKNDHSSFLPDFTGFLPVPSVSGIHIMPVGPRYGAYEDSNIGTEITWMCKNSGLDSFIDLNSFFHREKKYSLLKCLKCSLALRTRLGLRKWN